MTNQLSESELRERICELTLGSSYGHLRSVDQSDVDDAMKLIEAYTASAVEAELEKVRAMLLQVPDLVFTKQQILKIMSLATLSKAKEEA